MGDTLLCCAWQAMNFLGFVSLSRVDAGTFAIV
jgi:hypothetical protein